MSNPPRGTKEWYSGLEYFELSSEEGGRGGYADFDATRDFYREYAEMVDLAFGIRDQRLLDVGCAKGISVDEYLQRGANAWGTDISDHGVNEGPWAVQARIWAGDLGRPFDEWTASKPANAPDVFWLVTCVETIEHVFPWRVRMAVLNLARIAERWIYLTIPVGAEWDRNDEHLCIRPEEWWRMHFDEVAPALVRRDDMEDRVRRIRVGTGRKLFKVGDDNGTWPWCPFIYERQGEVPRYALKAAQQDYEAGEALHAQGKARYDGFEPEVSL